MINHRLDVRQQLQPPLPLACRHLLQALHDSGLDVVARFLGDFRPADREWAEALGLGDRLELLPYAPRAASLALQRDSEALLLLIPEAEGRGRGVLSGKVFEYIAVGRPILAAVPPDGAAATVMSERPSPLTSPNAMPCDATTKALIALICVGDFKPVVLPR